MMGTSATQVHLNKPLTAFALLGLGLIAFAFGYFMDTIGIKVFLLIIFALIGVAVMALPYKWAIRLLFFYVGFEGMAKILSGYNPIVHVGSDLLVLALTAKWFLIFLVKREKLPEYKPPLLIIFAVHFVWFLIEFANPYSLGLLPSIAGAKLYITMALLYAYGFYLATDLKEVHWFMGIWVFVGALQVILSLQQSAIGPASVLMISGNYVEPLRKFRGQAFRPFGMTALAGGPSIYIFLMGPFLIYFLIQSRSFLLRIALGVLLPASVVAIAFCQVRSALVKMIIGGAMFILLGFTQAPREVKKRIFFSVPVAALLLSFLLPKMTEHWVEYQGDNAAAFERSMTAFDATHITTARAGGLERMIDVVARVPLGAGLSRTGAAAGAAARFMDGPDPYFPEGFFSDNFWVAVIAEMGLPGAFIITLLIVMIIVKGYMGLRMIKNPGLSAAQAVILSSLIMIVIGLWGAEGLLYNPEAPFFWFFAGVLMRLPDLDTATRV
jgi:hypothetical protein